MSPTIAAPRRSHANAWRRRVDGHAASIEALLKGVRALVVLRFLLNPNGKHTVSVYFSQQPTNQLFISVQQKPVRDTG